MILICSKMCRVISFVAIAPFTMQSNASSPVAAELYSAHHAWLTNWLVRRVRDTADAADLAHDTFVRVICRATPELATVREPRAYLTSIAKGLVVDHWRRRDIEAAYLDALAQLPEAQTPSPEERLIVLETLMRARQKKAHTAIPFHRNVSKPRDAMTLHAPNARPTRACAPPGGTVQCELLM